MPPGLLVNDRGELVHAFSGASRFLRARDGRQGLDIVDLVDGELKMILSSGLKRVAREPSALIFKGVRIEADGETGSYRVGVAGLALVDKTNPDIVILDLGLPELDGFEVARRIRRDPRHAGIFLIALTGYGQSADRHAAKEAGFDEHLVKPVQTEQLLNLLSELRRPSRAETASAPVAATS